MSETTKSNATQVKAALMRRLNSTFFLPAFLLIFLIGLVLGTGDNFRKITTSIKSNQKIATLLHLSNPSNTQKEATTDQKIIANNALIPTKIMGDRSKTFVKVTYQEPQNPFVMWLVLETDSDANKVEVLLDHPFLKNLSWPKVSNTSFTLYQRQKTYSSIEAFIKTPPKQVTIAADPLLIEKRIVPTSTISLDKLDSIENVDYILTTYHPTYEESGYRVAETVIDASNGKVKNDTLRWWLSIPSASEQSPLYLKNVDVSYNQPS